MEPFLQGETQVGAGLPGVTIKNDFEKIGPLEHWNVEFKKKRHRVRDRFSAMGEGQMLQRVAFCGFGIVGIVDRDRYDPRQSTDVFSLDGTASRLEAAGIIPEKAPMAFLDISVLMTSLSGHEREVAGRVII